MEIVFNGENIDEYVYIRDGKTKRLVHRDIAFKEIYLKNRKKYPLPFSKYIVHHKDGNKFNNSVENLKIVTKQEHSWIHGKKPLPLIPRDVKKLIESLKKMSEEELDEKVEEKRE